MSELHPLGMLWGTLFSICASHSGKEPIYVPLSDEGYFAFHTIYLFIYFGYVCVRGEVEGGQRLFLLSSGSVLAYTCLLAWLIGMHWLLFIVSPEDQRGPGLHGVFTQIDFEMALVVQFSPFSWQQLEEKRLQNLKRLHWNRGGALRQITKHH